MALLEKSLEEAISLHFSKEVKIKKWDTLEFTKSGDNFSTTVKCIEVQLDSENKCTDVDLVKTEGGGNGDNKVWKCIIKNNQEELTEFFKIFSKFAFETEVHFFTNLLPNINRELELKKMSTLNTPKYYGSSLAEGKEFILIEDLRQLKLKMSSNPRVQMNIKQSTAVLKELAKLHATSHFWLLKNNRITSTKVKNFIVNPGPIQNIFKGLLESRINAALQYLEKLPKQEKAISWLKSLSSNKTEVMNTVLGQAQAPFQSLCHGDTWTNNFLLK